MGLVLTSSSDLRLTNEMMGTMPIDRDDIYAGVEEGVSQAPNDSDDDSELEPEESALDIDLRLVGDEDSGYVSNS